MNNFKNSLPQESKTNAQQVRAQNQQSQQGASGISNTFATEFGSETNVQQVRAQNQKSQQNAGGVGNAFATEFGSETNVQQVRQQNAASIAKKNQQGQQGNQF